MLMFNEGEGSLLANSIRKREQKNTHYILQPSCYLISNSIKRWNYNRKTRNKEKHKIEIKKLKNFEINEIEDKLLIGRIFR